MAWGNPIFSSIILAFDNMSKQNNTSIRKHVTTPKNDIKVIFELEMALLFQNLPVLPGTLQPYPILCIEH